MTEDLVTVLADAGKEMGLCATFLILYLREVKKHQETRDLYREDIEKVALAHSKQKTQQNDNS